jgi:hypothetical protein
LDCVVQQMGAVSTTAVARLQALMNGEPLPKGPVRVPAMFHPAEDARAIIGTSLAMPIGAESIKD